MSKNYKSLICFLSVLLFSVGAFATSPHIVNTLYQYAHNKDYAKIRHLVKQGYSVDTKDDGWRTAYCLAKEKNDTVALRVLEVVGADINQICSNFWGSAQYNDISIQPDPANFAEAGTRCGEVICKKNAVCYDGICSCPEGYLDYEEACYAPLTCQENAHQERELCLCNVGYVGFENVCYTELVCQENAHQEKDVCLCDEDYLEFEGVCYEELLCEDNAHQEKNLCLCNDGYSEFDGLCHKTLVCQENAHQEADKCVCNTGYSDFKGMCYIQQTK